MIARVHPALPVAGVTFLALVSTAGVLSATTMYVRPFETEFGWTAAQISIAQAIVIALSGLSGPFAAASMERYGVRRTALAALLVLACASLAITHISAAWQLVPYAIAVGISVANVGLTLGATIANRWFVKNRSLVVGLFSAGNATGQLVFLPLFGWLVEHDGWRSCAYLLTGVALALFVVFALVIRERPVDVGVPPYGAETIEPAPTTRRNPLTIALRTLGDAARTRIFWILGGSFLICGASTNGLIAANLVPACADHGIGPTQAAGLLALMGAFDLLGTTGSGWLTDRFDARWLLFMYYGLRGLALLWLPLAFGMGVFGLPLFAAFYGLDWLATVPPTLKLATAAFGRERAPIVFGWIVALHQLGAGVTALAAGWTRTALGSYDLAFVTSGGLALAAALLVLTVAAQPRREARFAPVPA